ncbi:MAG: phosphoribosylanthranilate isomerase [Desulfobacterales bacterium]|nr:phosphoribosylanthranilate isomerase [Desulfobacterales bacterium]
MPELQKKMWQIPDQDKPLVKICGLTQIENALACAKAGADMIGLVFFKKSPRNVSFFQARDITRALPSHIPACGVFVNAGYSTIMETVDICKIRVVQLHGNEPPELVDKLSSQGLIVIKAFFAARSPELSKAGQYKAADFCLAEYGKGVLPGGNAETWDYGLASNMTKDSRLMLAGGLTPDNVAQAVSLAKPVAVDASSGVEAEPGLKDVAKVKSFIAAAKS